MFRAGKLRNLAEATRANVFYQRGDEAWQKGRLRPAFRFFLSAAQAGMVASFSTVGNFYHHGIGVKANTDAALYWYRQAYRNGARSVANNIGCILRDRKKVREAIKWFQRAVRQSDGDANLNIAKIYLDNNRDIGRAVRYLKKTRASSWATERSKEEARLLLTRVRADQPRASVPRRALSR